MKAILLVILFVCGYHLFPNPVREYMTKRNDLAIKQNRTKIHKLLLNNFLKTNIYDVKYEQIITNHWDNSRENIPFIIQKQYESKMVVFNKSFGFFTNGEWVMCFTDHIRYKLSQQCSHTPDADTISLTDKEALALLSHDSKIKKDFIKQFEIETIKHLSSSND